MLGSKRVDPVVKGAVFEIVTEPGEPLQELRDARKLRPRSGVEHQGRGHSTRLVSGRVDGAVGAGHGARRLPGDDYDLAFGVPFAEAQVSRRSRPTPRIRH